MIRDLLENNYVVVLDTNVLLNIYRYSPEFSEFAFECLKTIENHIVLPATVRLEYGRHYRGEFSKMERRIEDASKETAKQIEAAKTKIIASCRSLERLQFPDVEELKTGLSDKMDAVKAVLSNFFEDHAALGLIQRSWAGTDHLMNFIQTIDSAGQIMSPPSQEDIYRWCEDGETRYKAEIPPGFKDAKNKDGVRKYSDLILWQEILRYAKNQAVNVVFITDDVKADWWEHADGNRQFHSRLFEEFKKTGQQITPMTSQEFFADISESFGITKSDAVEIALRMTDDDYCVKIAESVFETVEEDLIYNATDYIDTDTANIGSEGIDEFEITECEFVRAERVNRDDSAVIYEFVFRVAVEGTSYEYWGRDEDTKSIILSDGRDHVFKGQIIVQVEREAEMFYDFEDDNSYETAVIVGGKLEQTDFYDRPEPPGELGYCPGCGIPLNIENDGGNGFCINCALEHD